MEDVMVELIKQNYYENKNKFKQLKEQLKNVVGNAPITHVGSTALPNMIGKNIIDILIGAQNEKEFEQLKKAITEFGFLPSKNSATEIYQFFASSSGETGNGDTHIHLGIIGTKRYEDFIILKKYLLDNADEATHYAEIKQNIVKNITTDRKEYRTKKGEYVTELIKRANNYYESKNC